MFLAWPGLLISKLKSLMWGEVCILGHFVLGWHHLNAAYYQIQGLMEDSYVQLINCCLHLFRSWASSFNSQYLLLFLKSFRSCVLLPTPFTSVICPSVKSWRRQFLLRMWPTQMAFLRRILSRNVLFSPIHSVVLKCILLYFSFHFALR